MKTNNKLEFKKDWGAWHIINEGHSECDESIRLNNIIEEFYFDSQHNSIILKLSKPTYNQPQWVRSFPYSTRWYPSLNAQVYLSGWQRVDGWFAKPYLCDEDFISLLVAYID